MHACLENYGVFEFKRLVWWEGACDLELLSLPEDPARRFSTPQTFLFLRTELNLRNRKSEIGSELRTELNPNGAPTCTSNAR